MHSPQISLLVAFPQKQSVTWRLNHAQNTVHALKLGYSVTVTTSEDIGILTKLSLLNHGSSTVSFTRLAILTQLADIVESI